MKKQAGLVVLTTALLFVVIAGVAEVFTSTAVSYSQKSAVENAACEKPDTLLYLLEPELEAEAFEKDKLLEKEKQEKTQQKSKKFIARENIRIDGFQKEEVLEHAENEFAIKELNKETNNLNILFLGAARDRLLMAAVYSINHQAAQEKYLSGAVFFPPSAVFEVKGKKKSLKEIYANSESAVSRGEIKEILERATGIKITYSVEIDKAVLAEVKEIFQPIIIDGKKLDLENLFEMCTENADQEILNELLNQLATPAVYFYHLPRLVLKFKDCVKTDFPVSAENLWFHFKIMRKIDSAKIKKVIAPGPVIPEEFLKNIFYEITVGRNNYKGTPLEEVPL